MTPLRSFFVLLAMCALPSSTSAQRSGDHELERFATLAKALRDRPVSEKPTPQMVEALELLIRAARRELTDSPKLTDEQLMKRLEPYTAALGRDPVAAPVDEPNWFDVHTASGAGRTAIAVTFGPVSRLSVFDGTDKRLPAPKQFDWFRQWHPTVRILDSGAIVLVSERVQAAGSRTSLRVDLLTTNGGTLTPADSLSRVTVLDLPEPKWTESRLTISSIDLPRSFMTAAAVPVFRRIEEYECTSTKLNRIKLEQKDLALRAVDAWIVAARKAVRPDKYQAIIKKEFPTPEFITYAIRAPERDVDVIIDRDATRLRFTLQDSSGRYVVMSVRSESIRRSSPQRA